MAIFSPHCWAARSNCVNVCMQPITCDDTGLIPSGSVGLQLPCGVFSLIHPFHLAFLTLAWPCRPVRFPGHWESSQYPVWAWVCFVFFCCELQNRGLILLAWFHKKRKKRAGKQQMAFITGDLLDYFLVGSDVHQPVETRGSSNKSQNKLAFPQESSFSFPIPAELICFNMP